MNFSNYKLTIQYKGTAYLGWQVQKGEGKTIQGTLNKALQKISKSEEVRSLASGRTDTGVHALGQVCNIRIPLEIPPANLVKALNTNLPGDIRIIQAEVSNEDFHPIRDSLWKEYWYAFSTERPGALNHELLAHHPYDLDFEAMKKACDIFVGEHDFCNFFCTGTETPTTVREIFECELMHHNEASGIWSHLESEHWIFRVRGSGFLKQMVRLIMGSLWQVGRGKVSLEQLEQALKEPLPRKLGAVAPACGLYLYKVSYP